ncbi:DoxX family protein [Candidatus Parcubacteria bacterium]|nr:DoxX family protein [Candidatus Parcubacteria bacterium]
MFNTFPTLLSFGILAPTILRITAGLIFASFGWLKLTKDKESKIKFFEIIKLQPAIVFLWATALVELIVGTMLVVGFLTQIASIIASVIMLASIVIKILKPKALPNTLDFYILFFIVFISLIFSGAGIFSFDLPL